MARFVSMSTLAAMTAIFGPAVAAPNACKLSSGDLSGNLNEGISPTPNPPRYAVNSGTLKAAMMFVDFPDAPANDTIDSLWDVLMPGAADYYRTASYGRLNLTVQADRTQFHRMPRPSGFYRIIRNDPGMRMGQYLRDAVTAATAQGSVAWESADVLWVVPTRKAEKVELSPTSLSPVTLPGNPAVRFKTAVTVGQDLHWKWAKFGGHKLLNHETGHSMGLPDLYPGDNFRQSKTRPLRTGEWVGGFDIMGLINGSSPDYLAWHKWKLGWLDDDQVGCIDAPTTTQRKFRIQPVEQPGGTKAVAVKLSSSKAFVLEARSRRGVNEGSCSVGLLPYLVDVRASNYVSPPVLVLDLLRQPGATEPEGCSPLRGGPLTSAALVVAGGNGTGRSYSSPEHGVSFTIDAVEDDAYDISISWSGAPADQPATPKGAWPLGFEVGPVLGGGPAAGRGPSGGDVSDAEGDDGDDEA